MESSPPLLNQMEKIKVVIGLTVLEGVEWKYFGRIKDDCLFRNSEDEVIKIKRENLDFFQDDSGTSYAYNLLTNRNGKNKINT